MRIAVIIGYATLLLFMVGVALDWPMDTFPMKLVPWGYVAMLLVYPVAEWWS